MARITDAKLAIKRDNAREVGKVTITGEISFSSLEMCLMSQCPKDRHYLVYARLRAVDYGKPDEYIYYFPLTKSLPDPTPSPTEACKFEADLGYSLLNEDPNDNPKDELIGEIWLKSYLTGAKVKRYTNVYKGYFD